MNIKVVLEYDGRGFAGWQQQARGRTVEAELKRALRELTGKDHTVYAAGRTDAGAHAEGRVRTFRSRAVTPPRGLSPRSTAGFRTMGPGPGAWWFRANSTPAIRP